MDDRALRAFARTNVRCMVVAAIQGDVLYIQPISAFLFLFAVGYSRSSGKDRARIFEIALGSTRESMIWYHAATPTLGDITQQRLDKLEEIRRLLLATIPRERGRLIRPKH